MLQVFLEPCQFGKSVIGIIRYKYQVLCVRVEILYHFDIFADVIFVCITVFLRCTPSSVPLSRCLQDYSFGYRLNPPEYGCRCVKPLRRKQEAAYISHLQDEGNCSMFHHPKRITNLAFGCLSKISVNVFSIGAPALNPSHSCFLQWSSIFLPIGCRFL